MKSSTPLFQIKRRGLLRSLAFFYLLHFSVITFADATSAHSPNELNPPETLSTSEDSTYRRWFGRSFDRTSLLIMGAGIGGSLIFRPHDESTNEQWVNHQRMNVSQARIGDLMGSGAPGLLIGLGQLYFDPENGEALLKSWVAVSIWTGILKTVASRRRPGGSLNRQSWPSGHTSVSFATATALGMAYGWKVGLPAGLIATGVGASRLADNRHWLSDVIGGAAVGIWMGYAYAVSPSLDSSATVTNISQASGPNQMSGRTPSTGPWLLYPSFENETVFLRLMSEY